MVYFGYCGWEPRWIGCLYVKYCRFLESPEEIVASLDQAVVHGTLTQREWIQRRDSARLRLGLSALPIRSWGQILGEGVLQAFIRLEIVETNSRLRSASANNAFMTQTMDIQTVSVVRGDNRVLEGVSFTVNAGEWVLLCGPSGAGKSTLLRVIAGLEAPEQGTLTRLGMSLHWGIIV